MDIDSIALYGAILSTLLALTGMAKFLYTLIKRQKEKNKFRTDLYYLTKIDNKSKKEHPIIVVLLANLVTERIAIKSIEYSGISKNGLKTSGSPGWYEQPEEAYGTRKRLLPIVIESGQTKDLPMFYTGIFENIDKLKIKLIDFDDREYFIDQCDIDKITKEINKRKNKNL